MRNLTDCLEDIKLAWIGVGLDGHPRSRIGEDELLGLDDKACRLATVPQVWLHLLHSHLDHGGEGPDEKTLLNRAFGEKTGLVKVRLIRTFRGLS